MSRNLFKKAIFIAVVVLASIFGMVGLPKSGRSLRANIAQRIHLGLDLQGGTHQV